MVRWFSQGCLIHSLKSWVFSFLFFSSSRPVNTFNCQKCTFWVRTKSTSKIFNEKYYWILRIRRPEFSSKFWFFLRCFQFLSHLAFKLWNDKLSKIEFLVSENLILVANFDLFEIFSLFVPPWVQILKCQTVKNWLFRIRRHELSSKFWFFQLCFEFFSGLEYKFQNG